MHGTKELQEAIEASMELLGYILELAQDGLTIGDGFDIAQRIATDDAFRGKMLVAMDGMSKIPDEIKDLDMNESVALSMVILSYVPRIVEKMNGKSVEKKN
jgi:hypothetical protein